jgi:hypothetical protein
VTDPAAYIAACPPLRAERLAAIRALALALPGVSESMEWNMPVFRRGDEWFAMANRAAYISIYLHDVGLVAALVAADKALKSGKGCLNVPDRAALPLAALDAAIRQRLGVAALR